MKIQLVIAVALLVVGLSSAANAQCTYRMIDVGRPHGYLSGPCNGAASNYAGAYPSHNGTVKKAPVPRPQVKKVR